MKVLPLKIRKRPLIGITVKLGEYAAWVRHAGADVILLADGEPTSRDSINGLLLTGGEDVDPALYGESNRSSRRVNPQRDRFELEVLAWALQRGIPILGVCRGMQLLAVSLGAKLYQDLSELESSSRVKICHRTTGHKDTTHSIQTLAHTILGGSVGDSTCSVNSHHHQGIRVLPKGLRASAFSSDGLIEAVEGTGEEWMLGIQWHPERWPEDSSSAIMESFLEECDRATCL